MPRPQTADARDTCRFERRERDIEGLDADEMRAIGARARHEVRVTVEDEGRALVLRDRGKRLDAVDQAALVGRLEPQQHGGNVGAGECRGEVTGKTLSIPNRRRDQVEAGGRPFVLRSSRHESRYYSNPAVSRHFYEAKQPFSRDRPSIGRAWPAHSFAPDGQMRVAPPRHFPICPTMPSAAPPAARGRTRK